MRMIAILMLLATMGLAGCSQKESTDNKSSESAETITAREAAQVTVKNYARELKSELMSAMTDGGPSAAIEVCRTRAPEVAAAHSTEGALVIKRVASRNRNPLNAASQDEMVILAQFADTTKEAADFVDNWRQEQYGKTYCYYQPIYTGGLCLNCHGSPEQIAPEVKSALAEYYPQDEAVGFSQGELRGMFVVEISWPEGKEVAKQLAKGSETHAE